MKFAKELSKWIEDGKRLRGELDKRGPILAHGIFGDGGPMTLREASRKTGLSPTYLSRVMNKSAPISPDAFLKLSKLAEQVFGD